MRSGRVTPKRVTYGLREESDVDKKWGNAPLTEK